MERGMCMNSQLEYAVKLSLLYGFVLTQPFVNYVDAYPELQNKTLFETDQLEVSKHGESDRTVQRKLHTLAYFDQETSNFDNKLKQMVTNSQNEYQLSITGKINKTTLTPRDAETEYKKQLQNFAQELQPGVHHEKVKIVQKSLQYFGYYEGKLDGIYGPLTRTALEIAEDELDLELISNSEASASTAQAQTTSSASVPNNKETNNQANNKEIKAEKTVQEVNKPKEVKKAEVSGVNGSSIIEEAHAQIGTPYVWGGTSPGGFDCSGFIQYVFQAEGITIPRTVSDIWNFSKPISEPSIGDLVFFETYKPGPSHLGIYVGNGNFIHAGESRGVEISELSNSYWESRYLGAKRVKQ